MKAVELGSEPTVTRATSGSKDHTGHVDHANGDMPLRSK
jgi:hypothetical protein